MRAINKKSIPAADCRVPTSSELPESKRENEYAAGSDDELAALQQRALLELGAADGGGQRRHAHTACYFFDHPLNPLLTYTYKQVASVYHLCSAHFFEHACLS